MAKTTGLQACPEGHEVYYPKALEEAASTTGQEAVFYTLCECGTVHLVVVWPSDGARVMASGGIELAERVEATGWPEQVHFDEDVPFTYRVADSLEIAAFLKG